MATGYTYKVQNGEIESFRDFALECSRAFGAAIHQRDDPSGPPTLRKSDTVYYDELIEDIEIKIRNLKKKSNNSLVEDYKKESKSAIFSNHEDIKNKLLLMARYQRMMALVDAWNPPTKDHENLKDFMSDQLADSIDFDCDLKYSEQYFKESVESLVNIV